MENPQSKQQGRKLWEERGHKKIYIFPDSKYRVILMVKGVVGSSIFRDHGVPAC